MERGNAKHSAREDDRLAAELSGALGRGGSNREEWADPEPPADDDPEVFGAVAVEEPATEDPEGSQPPPATDARAQHDLDVANDWHS